MAAGESDPRSGARVGGRAPRGAKLRGAPADLRRSHSDGAPGVEPDEHVQRVAAPGAGRGRRGGRGLRAGAHGPGAREPGDAGPARPGSDGCAVPGGGCGPSRRAAHHSAVARDTGGAGATRRQDRGDRHPLRRAPPARRDPLMRIAVITGGATAERAVAFAGAAQIVEALRSRGHTVRVVDTVTGLLSPTDESRLLTTAVGREPPAVAELDERERAMLSNGLAGLKEVTGADVLFLCLHAGRGEGGTLQALLDVIGVPYTGSGALGAPSPWTRTSPNGCSGRRGCPCPRGSW